MPMFAAPMALAINLGYMYLRRCFAVHRLVSWYQQGADVQKLLPHLSSYLGHVNIAATQIYLTMTPELLHEAAVRFERSALKKESND